MGDSVGERFAASRRSWVGDAITRFESDERVGAVLLTGSLGRGVADNWSDVDLVVVLAPGAERDVLAHRAEFVRGFGAAVIVFDSPWNAPLDGAQVNALYDLGCDWPLYVDWDLWPSDRGAISPDVRVLLNRAGLRQTASLFDDHRSWPRQPPAEPTPEHLQRARLAMLPIIAKCLVRGDVDRSQRMLTNLGYETDRTTPDLLAAARSMWNDIRPDANDSLARSIERMLLVTSQAVTRV
jgi:predicted nucleotidyltransferase